MRTAAILPVKIFAKAKQRLGESVADSLRLALARAMVGDVLVALRDCDAIERTIVVTNEISVATDACHLGALILADTAQDGQSAAVSLGITRAIQEGFERVLCIPGDCPALEPEELTSLLADRQPCGESSRRGRVLIVPDRHGTGTNGLLLEPPDAIEPSFGPDSFERHHALAKEAGVDCEVERPATLLLDIDTGEDLQALRERLRAQRICGARTRAVLEALLGSEPSTPGADRWPASTSAA